jgi:hypothetical protein
MNVLLTIEVWRASDFRTLNPRDYENMCENPDVKKLLEEGQAHVRYGDIRFRDEFAKLSTKIPGAVFQITELGPLFYRFWFTDGKWSSTQGEITFDDYKPTNLEPYEIKEAN